MGTARPSRRTSAPAPHAAVAAVRRRTSVGRRRVAVAPGPRAIRLAVAIACRRQSRPRQNGVVILADSR